MSDILGHVRSQVLAWSSILRHMTYFLMVVVWIFSVVNPPGSERLPDYLLGVIRRDHFLHLVAYGALSCGLFAGQALALVGGKEASKHTVFQGLLTLFAHSITKEVIQSFVPGRHGDASDVMADMFGASIGLLAVLFILNR